MPVFNEHFYCCGSVLRFAFQNGLKNLVSKFQKILCSLPKSVMETFKVVLTLESVDEILWCQACFTKVPVTFRAWKAIL